MGTKFIVFAASLILIFASVLAAQQNPGQPGGGRPGFGPQGGGPPGGGSRAPRNRELVKQFDKDQDGKLDDVERKAARRYAQENPARRGGRRGGPGGGGPPSQPTEPGPRVSPKQVKNYPDNKLYDESILRTFFLEFKQDDWEKELADFYRTDVEVPARLTVDGKTYENVGVGFRGNSSFFSLREGQKRSFNITLDYDNKDQNLYGYRTLNLLNSHSDPSFQRTVLYSHIARHYTAAPKANFVRVVVNGESWGIYINDQQYNKDFIKDWFSRRDGVRWKVPAGPTGRSLTYEGDKIEDYWGFELKSKNTPEAWKDLIKLCKTLDETPKEKVASLDSILSIDRALWFLALDNVLIDSDGYYSRGSDYVIYQEPQFGRFHVLPYDNNETFRFPGGGGPPGSGVQGGTPDGLQLNPFSGEYDDMKPLLSRLLADPEISSRYAAHVRTIVDEWLDWKKAGPLTNQYYKLIDAEIEKDTRKESSYADFILNMTDTLGSGRRPLPGLKSFFEERREYILGLPEFKKPTPRIESVKLAAANRSAANLVAGKPIYVQAKIGAGNKAERVMLYHAPAAYAPFQRLPMLDDGKHQDGAAGDGLYGAAIPAQSAGTNVHYYVEARTDATVGSTVFYPRSAESSPLDFSIPIPDAPKTNLIINEVMASNDTAVQDPQQQYEDYIELYNKSDQLLDLSGVYLTDSKSKPLKWAFPAGSRIEANGYLVVWLDEDITDQPGLHANFKLSKSGETLMLIEKQDGKIRLLDAIKFGPQQTDRAYGRLPNGSSQFKMIQATPAKPNK